MDVVLENADRGIFMLVLKIILIIISSAGIPFILFVIQGNIFCRLSLKNLHYKCEFSTQEAYEGDEITLIETVENRKFLPVLWLKVDIFTSVWLEFADGVSVVAQDSRYITSWFKLKGYQRTTRTWKVKCTKRGIFDIKSVSLASGDITKSYKKSLQFDVNASLIVYPSITDEDRVHFHERAVQGNVVVKRWILEDPFMVSGVREYTENDSMNKLHWNATAKTGHLMVKKNEFTSRPGIALLLNIQSQYREYYGTINKKLIEYGIKIAATILDRALEQGIPVRFGTNGIIPGQDKEGILTAEASGKQHTREILGILSQLELRKSCYFEDFLKKTAGNIENSDIIIITAYMTDEIYNIIQELNAKENYVKVIALQYLEPVYSKMLDVYIPFKDGEVSA